MNKEEMAKERLQFEKKRVELERFRWITESLDRLKRDIRDVLENDDMTSYERNLNMRRAYFVYEAAKLEAKISSRDIIPEDWEDRDDSFRTQFVETVRKQCSLEGFADPEEAHDSWWREYERMGWKYGPVRDLVKKTHPDMVPFNELPMSEREKDEIFLKLCDVARLME